MNAPLLSGFIGRYTESFRIVQRPRRYRVSHRGKTMVFFRLVESLGFYEYCVHD